MIKILVEKEKDLEGIKVSCGIIELDRGYLVLVSDQGNFGIGEVILGTPSTMREFGSLSSSSLLFGLKRNLLGKLIAEQVSKKLSKPNLVLFYIKKIKASDQKYAKILLDLIDECLDEIHPDKK